jgi:hypothetical protein
MHHPLAAGTFLAALVLGAVLVCPIDAAAAADADSVAAPGGCSPSTLLASFEGFKNWFVAHVMSTFSYRERMIQMLAVGLFIGLFIMLRKMPGQT